MENISKSLNKLRLISQFSILYFRDLYVNVKLWQMPAVGERRKELGKKRSMDLLLFYYCHCSSLGPPLLWVQGCGVTKGWVVSFLPLPLCGFCVRIHGRRYPFGCLIIHLCSPVSIFLLCYLLFSQAVGGWVFGEKVFLSFRAGSFLASRKLKMA